jgi:small-conductance mechanosensitive channel
MRLPITHDLNRNINVALTEKSIEIPFPQRDLHIKSDS